MDRQKPNYCIFADYPGASECAERAERAERAHTERGHADAEEERIIPSVNPWDREAIEAETKPRLNPCPRGLIMCCGSCTHICPDRCRLDTQSRLYMYYLQLKNTPGAGAETKNTTENENENENETETAAKQPSWELKMLSEASLNRQQATNLVDQITSRYHMSKERRRSMGNNGFENTNKFDYAPRIELDPVTGGPLIDPSTGNPRIIPWPDSGLCKYCLPRTSPYGKVGRPPKHIVEQRYPDGKE